LGKGGGKEFKAEHEGSQFSSTTSLSAFFGLIKNFYPGLCQGRFFNIKEAWGWVGVFPLDLSIAL
jgi:hypothetical protein